MKTHILKIVLLGFTLFMACSQEVPLTPADDDQKLVQLSKEIEEFAKNKVCFGGDNCKTMAMGSKPCGGPTSYIIYSLSKTDEKQLSDKVKQYTDLQKELNIKYNRISDCSLLIPPTVDCLNGICASK
ncbi:MAG: hypothetical protein H7339_07990 [Arcicella sp.]|nr:hypothetical protein [Arcicella sp.]